METNLDAIVVCTVREDAEDPERSGTAVAGKVVISAPDSVDLTPLHVD